MLIKALFSRYLTIFIFFFIWLAVAIVPNKANAMENCKYSSTQARIQQSIHHDWTQSLQLGCQQSFRIGSFHDHTGKFANDTTLTVTQPSGAMEKYVWWKGNGRTIPATQNGTYTLKVTSIGQSGAACEETATVTRNCDGTVPEPTILPPPIIVPGPQPTPSATPVPQPGQCQYSSTQARVQKDIKHDWQRSLSLNCGESFRVGGFHNGTGQFSNNVRLAVVARFDIPLAGEVTYQKQFSNGATVRTFVYPATYTLHVTTPNQGGAACQDTATVAVTCSSWFDWLKGWNQVE